MSQQDVKLRLEPGETKEIQRPGRFIFCKFSDRQVSLIMDQARIEMEAGDKHVSADRFSSFQVQNLDQEREAYLIFVVGDGDYDRMIVQGEIAIEPILRSADGTTRADTRTTISLDLSPSNLALTTYQEGDVFNKLTPAKDDGTPYTSLSSSRAYAFKGRGGLFTFYEYDSTTDTRNFYEYDANMELVNVVKYPNNFAASAFDWTYRPGVGYQFTAQTSSTDRLYTLNSDGTISQVKNFGNTGAFRFFDWADELGMYVAATNGKINAMYGDYGDVFKLLDATVSQNPIRWDPISQELQNAYFSDLRCYDLDGNLTRVRSLAEGNFSYGFAPVNQEKSQVCIGDDPVRLANVALETYSTKPEFVARRPGCELASAMIKPGRVPQVTAEIEATAGPEGVQLTGEIIKAAIEFYYKRKAPDNYLDHVYYLDISRDESGLPFRAISSGNSTFDRANVADSFGVLTPAQIVLTMDNELELGAAI